MIARMIQMTRNTMNGFIELPRPERAGLSTATGGGASPESSEKPNSLAKRSATRSVTSSRPAA